MSTPLLRPRVGRSSTALGSFTKTLCLKLDSRWNLKVERCVLSANLVSWTQDTEYLESMFSISKWPFFLMPFVFTVRTLIELQVCCVEETLASGGKAASDRRHRTIISDLEFQHGDVARVETVQLLQRLKVVEQIALPLHLSPLLHAVRTKVRS